MRSHPDVALINIDLDLSNEGLPTFWRFELPQFRGWVCHMIHSAKYSIYIVLIKPYDNEKEVANGVSSSA